MNYKTYIIEQLNEQNLYFDTNTAPYNKLNSNDKLTQKELNILFKKIGTNQFIIEQRLNHLKTLISLFEKHLIYINYDKAEFVYSELTAYNDFLPHSSYNYYVLLLKIRYYMAKSENKKIEIIIKKITKESTSLSPLEKLFFQYLKAVKEMMEGNFTKANEELQDVIDNMSTLFGFEGEVYYQFSIAKTYLEEPSRAIYYGKKALDHLNQQYNYKRILHAQMSLAINCAYAKIYEEAADYYDHLLRNALLLNQQDLIPHIYHNMGDLYSKMENHSMALAYFNMAINHYEIHDAQFGMCLFNLGLTELKLDKLNNAKETFYRLLDVAEELRLENFKLYAKYHLIKLEENVEEAISYLETTILPYTASKPSEKNMGILFSDVLVRYYRGKGDYEKAFTYITDDKYTN